MERSVGIHPDCVKFDIQISAMTLDTRRGGSNKQKVIYSRISTIC